MTQASCVQEERVLQAARTGIWEEALSAHVTGCAACREVVVVSRSMRVLAESSEGTHPLPDAGRLWRRAQFSEKHAEADRALKILDWAEFIFALLIFGGVAGWIGWNWDAIQIRMSSVMADTWQQLWMQAFSVGAAVPILSSSGIVILSLIAVAIAYPLLARD